MGAAHGCFFFTVRVAGQLPTVVYCSPTYLIPSNMQPHHGGAFLHAGSNVALPYALLSQLVQQLFTANWFGYLVLG